MIIQKKMYSLLILLFCSVILVNAQEEKASISGSVYNIFLEEIDNAVITIDTSPKQIIVSKDGSYELFLNPGNYTLSAVYSNEEDIYETQEEIQINMPGDYTIDLILIPSLDSDDISNTEFEVPQNNNSYLGGVIIIITLGLMIFFLRKYKKRIPKKEDLITSESEKSIEDIINFIKKSGGRTTQKDIRKHFPSSEAKISLMLTELESNGAIQRIKKGRGNIIILKKEV